MVIKLMLMDSKLYGGVEAGGTNFVCGVGSGGGELVARVEIPTTTPEQTMAEIFKFFSFQKPMAGVGIGSFGPIQLNENSKDYGTILNTPKPGWAGVNIGAEIASSFNVSVHVETDTDVAAIGEYYHGKAVGEDNFLYLTFGTGVGGSIMENGKLMHGVSQFEMGHSQIPPVPADLNIGGACQFHKYCVEGFTGGASLEKIYGKRAENIDDEVAWQKIAYYIGQGIYNIIVSTSPGMIILGGSIVTHRGLIEQIRTNVETVNNQFLNLPNLEKYIVHASSDTIGVLGAIKLASLQ